MFVTLGNNLPRHCEPKAWQSQGIASAGFASLAMTREGTEIAEPVSKRKREISLLAMTGKKCH
jgi:hypothetical protein